MPIVRRRIHTLFVFICLAFLFLAPPLSALTPEEDNTIKIFRDAADSVVFISNQKTINYVDVYAERTTEIPRGTGSGFVWDKKGHIVTNYHVVHGGDVFYVTLRDQTRYRATLVGFEDRKDLAVLKIDPAKVPYELRPVKVGNLESLQVGQKALAIGNPYGLDHTLTEGIVSALGRQIRSFEGVTIRDVIQTDASINPGNSGGPLLDSGGALIGMNTAIYSETGSNAGIGFAIPVSVIKKLVPQIISFGKVVQPALGVSVLTGPETAEIHGAIIRSVEKGSAAERAGLQGVRQNRYGEVILGDIVVAIDNRRIDNFDDLYNALDHYRVGDEVKVKVLSQGRERIVAVKLQKL